MKRFASIFFAFAILLSSGLVQFVVHICPEKGVLMSSGDCAMHAPVKKADCCRSSHMVKKVADDCCDQATIYAVSAKFGSIAVEKLAPCFTAFPATDNYIETFGVYHLENTTANLRKGKPPLYNRSVLRSQCSLLI